MIGKCKDCLYYDIELNECHRYPYQTSDKLMVRFPICHPDNWCGEFMSKGKKENTEVRSK